MMGELTNHVWQSTLFAVMACLLTVALRKNRAQVRFWLWFSASFKFLVPFSLLITLGSHLQWAPATPKITAVLCGSVTCSSRVTAYCTCNCFLFGDGPSGFQMRWKAFSISFTE